MPLGGRLDRHYVAIVVDRGDAEPALALRRFLEERGESPLRLAEGDA